MSVSIKILKGPLNDTQLAAIARLYGPTDPKYASLDFCRTQFNLNPFGYSYHAFGVENGREIAHFAIIPLLVDRGGHTVIGGKGEALCVDSGYRSLIKDVDGNSIILAVSLSKAVQKIALENGVKVVVMIADSAVGTIHRVSGCKPVLTHGRYFELSMRAMPLSDWSLIGGLKKGFKLLQGVVGTLAMRLFSPNEISKIIVDKSILEKTIPDIQTDEWTIAKDPSQLAWMLQKGKQAFWQIGDLGRGYAIVYHEEREGAQLNILAWRPRRGSLWQRLRLLSSIVLLARRRGASSVCCLSWKNLDPIDDFAATARWFCFRSRKMKWPLLLRTSDDSSIRLDNIRFHHGFYSGF